MSENNDPQVIRFLESMAKHGERDAGERFSADHPLPDTADSEKEFEWAQDLCAFLNENYDCGTVRAIRIDCACGPEHDFESKLKEVYDKEKDPYAFVRSVNGLDLGFSLDYDGNCYCITYPQCYCSCVNRVDRRLPEAWCWCTVGYGKRLFGYILDREVRAELISSIKQGAAQCRIAIYEIPETEA